MASTYSTNLGFELPGTGDQAGTWGITNNTNIGTLIEQAISGYVTQAITDGADTVITIPNGSTGVARNMSIEMTGALTAARNLIVPANRKLYFIFNNTTGSQSVTVKVSGQTGVSVPNGQKMVLVCNGTDVVTAVTYAASMSVGSLTLPNGAANGVAYLNASKVVTAGSTLTFDGVQTLSVFGTGNSVLHLEGSTTNNGVMRFRNGTTGALSGLIGNNSKDLVFESNGAVEQMRLTSAGNFGIGTASPANYSNYRNLAINGTTGGNIDMLSNGTKVGNLFNDGTNFYAYNVIAGSMVFGTNNTERARFDSNGNLGIGTSGIAARGNLDVSSGNLSGSQTRSIHLGYSASDFYGFRVTNINDAGSTFAGTFRVQRGTGSVWSDDLVVTNAGNVAIGTASPQAATPTLNKGLYIESSTNNDVVGYSLYVLDGVNNRRGAMFLDDSTGLYGWDITATSGVPSYVWRTGAIERMRLTSDGDVGIGLASPGGYGGYTALQINNATNGGLIDLMTNGTRHLTLFAGATTSTIGTASNTALGFMTNAVEKMRLDSSGNLGIGTASPATKFVVSNAGANGFEFDPTAGIAQTYNRSGAAYTGYKIYGLDLEFRAGASPAIAMTIDSNRNIVAGASAALATTATNGFLYVPTCAGTPTGTPTAITGMAPIVVNTTNNKLYFYSGGAWRDAGP